MTIVETLPIACTLGRGDIEGRRASIAALNKDALLKYDRRDLVLQLHYAAKARERVHEMVRNELTCCAFLAFELHEAGDEVRLTVTVPERAREAAGALFEQFVANAPSPSSCACASSALTVSAKEPPGSKAAGAAAMTLSTGALACGACCVLPFTLPVTLLASTGSVLSSLVRMHWWMTALSVLAVMGAWGWIAWQGRRSGRKPATMTLVMMTASTVFMAVSLMWPLIEKPLIRAIRA
jgi:hypothetical protein